MKVDAEFKIDQSVIDGLTKKEVNDLIKEITIDTHNEIVYRTPVDTGAARSSWDYSFSNNGGVLEGTINNYVPYIGILENGRVIGKDGKFYGSEQAPKGMVAISLQNIKERYS